MSRGVSVKARDSSATAPLLRRINASAVLDYLTAAGAVTGTEVMAATGLSRPTVHTLCDHLIALGWVTELDGRRPEGNGRSGRPARCYQFNALAGYVLGIDLGENKVSVVLSDLRGDPLATTTSEFPSIDISARDRVVLTRRAVRVVLKSAGVDRSSVFAAGMGVAAPVTTGGHLLVSNDYLPGMASLDLVKSVGQGYAWPILVENDANLAALGERWRGVAAGVDNLIVILAGERLGAGLYLGGQLIRGHDGGAGELGFLEMVEGVGGTEGIGAVARIQGRTAVAAAVLARQSAGPDRTDGQPHSLLALAGGDPARVTGNLVTAAARAGDPVALEILDGIAERMARVVGVLATMLNPEMVVIGGRSADVLELIHDRILEHLPPFTKESPRLEPTRLGDRGVLWGAVRLALDHVQAHVFDSLTELLPAENHPSLPLTREANR